MYTGTAAFPRSVWCRRCRLLASTALARAEMSVACARRGRHVRACCILSNGPPAPMSAWRGRRRSQHLHTRPGRGSSTEQREQHIAAFVRETRGCTTGVRHVLHAVVGHAAGRARPRCMSLGPKRFGRPPRSAHPPLEPTHLLGHAARADSALRRRRPATEAALGWFPDGFIAVILSRWRRSSPGIHSASTPKLFIFRTKVD